MYASLRTGTHHIFFPPRLQTVVLENQPNRFAADPLHMTSFDGLEGEQFRCPSTSTLRRIAAGQRHDSSLIGFAQQSLSSRSSVAIHRVLKARVEEALTRSAHGCDTGARRAGDFVLLLPAAKKLKDPCPPRRQSIDL
jgi:hypothetical protein